MFIVVYTSSLSIAVQRYVELVRDMQAIMYSTHPQYAAPPEASGVYLPGLLTVLGVVVVGMAHAGFVVVHFSRLGLSSSDGSCEGRMSSPIPGGGSLISTGKGREIDKKRDLWDLDIYDYYATAVSVLCYLGIHLYGLIQFCSCCLSSPVPQ